MQDLNSSDIDAEALCNLAIEEAIKCATTKFENYDLFLRSLSYFFEAIEINTGNYRAHLGLGMLLLSVECYEDAKIFLQNAYDMKPRPDIQAYLEIAETEIKNKKSTKIENAVIKKKNTITDILQMTDKFKK